MFVNEKNKRNFWMLAVLLLALPLAVWSCRDGSQAEEQQTETTEQPAADQPADQPAATEHPEGSEHPEGGEHPEGSEHPEKN